MSVQRTRTIQLLLPIGPTEAAAVAIAGRRGRFGRRRRPAPRIPAIPECPNCGGAMARGEGFLVCAVCAYTADARA